MKIVSYCYCLCQISRCTMFAHNFFHSAAIHPTPSFSLHGEYTLHSTHTFSWPEVIYYEFRFSIRISSHSAECRHIPSFFFSYELRIANAERRTSVMRIEEYKRAAELCAYASMPEIVDVDKYHSQFAISNVANGNKMRICWMNATIINVFILIALNLIGF